MLLIINARKQLQLQFTLLHGTLTQ